MKMKTNKNIKILLHNTRILPVYLSRVIQRAVPNRFIEAINFITECISKEMAVHACAFVFTCKAAVFQLGIQTNASLDLCVMLLGLSLMRC